MNAKNLPLKFAFVALLILVSVWVWMAKGPKYGIDIGGGHSLIFEIRTNQAEVDRIDAAIAELTKELASPKEGRAEEDIRREITRLEEDRRRYQQAGRDPADMVKQMIAVLEKRIDPMNLRGLQWRPLGDRRFEVRMPAASWNPLRQRRPTSVPWRR